MSLETIAEPTTKPLSKELTRELASSLGNGFALEAKDSEKVARAIADKTVSELLRIGAINFSGPPYYTLTSGKKSPVYVDCRKIISYPEIAAFVTNAACSLLSLQDYDAIAGGETAGIPFAAWLAAKMEKPMLYVRKKPKGFGLGARIEGVMPLGKKDRKPNVLLVEDHASDGASKISFVEALRDAGADTTDAFVVFHYDVFTAGEAALREKNITLHALATWRDAYGLAEERGNFSAEILSDVRSFLKNPVDWQKAHP